MKLCPNAWIERALLVIVLIFMLQNVDQCTNTVSTKSSGSTSYGSCYCRSQYNDGSTTPCQLYNLGNGRTAVGCAIGIPTN
jgi:hypothetical protein